MENYKKYDIELSLVTEEDAQFILDLRTDASKSRFISKTDYNIDVQKNWIKEYKKREKVGVEFYFIAIDNTGQKFATYRLYNFDPIKNEIEIGSFISKPNYTNASNIVKLDILIKEYAFEVLGVTNVNFEVRKKNISVQNYHKKFLLF